MVESYCGVVTFNGVLIEMYPVETSGTLEFTVDGNVCPDTNGVEINLAGGLFNCSLTGFTFKV